MKLPFARSTDGQRRTDCPEFDATPVVDSGADTIEDRRHTIKPAIASLDDDSRRAIDVLQKLRAHVALKESLEIHSTLGHGGMGVVHLATQVALGRKVAVKTVRPDQRSDAATMKLLHEGWLTGVLEHPNVVPVHDLALDEHGSPVIVLKRIEGEDWGALLADESRVRERFRVSDVLEWHIRVLMTVCNAVHFAHTRGIVHRDLKPENVMIGAFGEVYVVDWGIAVSTVDDATGRLPLASEAREMAGTPCYMAPEMLGEKPPRISPRTDVYLLGASLYEIAARRSPHEAETLMLTLQKVVRSKPAFGTDVPSDLVRICERAMAADPDARFETAEQLRLALQGFLQHRGSAQIAAAAQKSLVRLRESLASAGGGTGAAIAELQPVRRVSIRLSRGIANLE